MRRHDGLYRAWPVLVLLLVAGGAPFARPALAGLTVNLASNPAQATPTNTSTPIPTETPGCSSGWAYVPAPNILTGYDQTRGVAGAASADVWAAGETNSGTSLLAHWDGTAWTPVSSPNIGALNAVSAWATNDVWAVGFNGILHWDGAVWSQVSAPANSLNGIAVVAANDAWAVGSTGILHWNGAAWTTVSAPNIGTLTAVSARAANDVWAIGNSASLHYDGAAWMQVPVSAGNLTGVVAVAANDAWIVGWYLSGGYARTLTQHWNGSAWAVVPSPSFPNLATVLYAVAGGAGGPVWAVGYYEDPAYIRRSLILRWDGSAWSVVTSSNPGQNNILAGVAVLGPNDAWAVGDYYQQGFYHMLPEHYTGPCGSPTPTFTGTPPTATRTRTPTNTATATPTASPTNSPTPSATAPPTRTATPTVTGTPPTATATAVCPPVWTVVPGPTVSANSELEGVAVIAPDDVWAVGYTGGGGQSLDWHWNGSAWSNVPSPGGADLLSVSAVAANDVWAVGRGPLAEHWNGSAWSLVAIPPVPSGTLYGVDARATNDVWAVGVQYNATGQTWIIHWDGSSWSTIPSPSFGTRGSILSAVDAVAANDVWAVGYYDAASGGPTIFQTLMAHWDGSTWSVVPSPNVGPNFNQLTAVAAVATNDVWAVGYWCRFAGACASGQTLTEHWDGSQWSVVPSPNIGSTSWPLGVAAQAGNDVWAAGFYSAGTNLTLIMHWDGAEWSIVPSPNPGSSNLLRAVAAGRGDVWAVGGYAGSVGQPLTERYTVPCPATPTPTVTGTPPTATNTRTPTITPTSSGTPTATYTPLPTATGTPPTATRTGTRTVTPTWTPGIPPTPTRTVTPAVTGTPPSATPTRPPPTSTHTPAPAGTPTPGATGTAPPPSATANPPTVTGTLPPSATGIPPTHTVTPIRTPTGLPASMTPVLPPTRTPGRSPTGTPPIPSVTAPPTRTASPSPTPPLTPCAVSFSDVHPSDYFYEPVLYLACRGVVSGYSDGTFRPYNTTTRGQMVKIVVLGGGRPFRTPPDGGYTFADVPPAHPFFVYIETAAVDGIVSGYDCGGRGEACDEARRRYLRPAASVTRGQLSKITVGAVGWPLVAPPVSNFSDVAPGSAFYSFVETAACHGIVSGYDCGGPGEPCDGTRRPYFRQSNNATRGQIAKIVYGALTSPATCQSP